MKNKLVCITLLIVALVITAGCGGGSKVNRQLGLSPEQVVHTFFEAAKDNKMSEAAAYVSPTSASDTQTVLKFVTGQDRKTVKNSNLLSVKNVAQQGNYAAVVATLQQQNSLAITVKPVGLEKINGEWYIVDYEQALRDAKYKVLAQLLKGL